MIVIDQMLPYNIFQRIQNEKMLGIWENKLENLLHTVLYLIYNVESKKKCFAVHWIWNKQTE